MLPEMYIALRKTELLDLDRPAVHVREDREGAAARRSLSVAASWVKAMPATVADVVAGALWPAGSLRISANEEFFAGAD